MNERSMENVYDTLKTTEITIMAIIHSWYLVGLIYKVKEHLMWRIHPFIHDLVAATTSCHIFIKFNIGIIYKGLPIQLQFCENQCSEQPYFTYGCK